MRQELKLLKLKARQMSVQAQPFLLCEIPFTKPKSIPWKSNASPNITIDYNFKPLADFAVD